MHEVKSSSPCPEEILDPPSHSLLFLLREYSRHCQKSQIPRQLQLWGFLWAQTPAPGLERPQEPGTDPRNQEHPLLSQYFHFSVWEQLEKAGTEP